MKDFIKNNGKYLILFTLAGLVGGFLTGMDLLDTYPVEIKEQLLSQGMDEMTLTVVTAVQYAAYGLFLGIIGIFLAGKIGLWQDAFTIEIKPLIAAVFVGVVGGISMLGFDLLWFGKEVPAIADSYLIKPTAASILGAMILGGVVEEVMLRLFIMSLIAFVLIKLFRGEDRADRCFIIANVVSSILFAAGHIPMTEIMLGITPLILFRCFLLNGGLGLLFGRLYRKSGIQYAMIAHAGCHLVSKLIWMFCL